MAELGIREEDLVERFIRGSGPGGQKINKTSSCVVIRHRPTGIEVRCARERSQARNRWLARWELCERLEEQRRKAEENVREQIECQRRTARRPPRWARRLQIEEKRLRSRRKADRRPPRDLEE